MKKLPTLWKNETKVTADKARERDVDFGDKLANLRKATGRPETVEIPMRWSVTGNSATFLYTRMDAGEKFKLAQTIKGANGSNGAGALFANLLHRDVPPHAVRRAGVRRQRAGLSVVRRRQIRRGLSAMP